jgi:hypothetical protein
MPNRQTCHGFGLQFLREATVEELVFVDVIEVVRRLEVDLALEAFL